jgi:hypothetical protein
MVKRLHGTIRQKAKISAELFIEYDRWKNLFRKGAMSNQQRARFGLRFLVRLLVAVPPVLPLKRKPPVYQFSMRTTVLQAKVLYLQSQYSLREH